LCPIFYTPGAAETITDAALAICAVIFQAAAKYGRYMPVRHFIDENIAKKPGFKV